jgi:hypothetical protein
MYFRFIRYHFQYMERTSFDTAPASATIAFNNTDYSVSVLSPAVQVTENPQ